MLLISTALLAVSLARTAAAAEKTAVQLAAENHAIESAPFPGKGILTDEDERFLDDLERRGIQFFLDTQDPVTGLMPDRAKADGSKPGDVASTASVGFGLTALCIGVERGWVPREDAYKRACACSNSSATMLRRSTDISITCSRCALASAPGTAKSRTSIPPC